MTPDFTKEHQTEFWRFKNHPDKQSVLDANRDWFVGDGNDWWQTNYDWFVDHCKAQGFTPSRHKIFWSGFWSQGDGAAFYELDGYDLPLLLQDYKFITAEAMNIVLQGCIQIGIAKNSYANHYCHANTFYAAVYFCESTAKGLIEERYPGYKNREMREEVFREVELSVEDIDAHITELFRQAANDLYQDLRDDYDDLTSDETLSDRFSDDDLVFDIHGNMEIVTDLAA